MKYPDLLLHLDTLGFSPSSALIGIGACPFDLKTTDLPPMLFYRAISSISNEKHGRTVDAETLDWWRTDATYNTPFEEPLFTLEEALGAFNEFFATHCDEDTRVWFWSAAREGGILTSAFEDVTLPAPWAYYQAVDARTYARVIYMGEFGHTMASPMGDSPDNQMQSRAKAIRECSRLYKHRDMRAA